MRRVFGLLLPVVLAACSGSGAAGPGPEGGEPDAAPSREVSPFEVAPPHLDDPAAFWARDDLYVMRPDVEPTDRWPEEVLDPDAHGVRIIALLPGDYRGRSNGALPPGVLYIPASGTADEPLLVTYASAVGADLRADPHPAERGEEEEARLVAIRIWNERHQYFRGLTFRDGFSSCLMRETSGSVIDACLWHETAGQPLRIRFDAHHNLVQRCVMRRFDRDAWAAGDTVAIQVSDGACTHNRIVANVVLNYTDSYQHTDRDGEPYGLGAGTILDGNFFGFTPEAYVQGDEGELLCGENALDFKMGGTQAEPVLVTNNVFFGTRASRAGCAASGSGGYAITFHRRGTWIELRDNLFVDLDSGVFLNTFFEEVDPARGRIDPQLTLRGNLFSGVRSLATAFPSRTGRVLTGLSPATFRANRLVDCERLMDSEPFPGVGELVVEDNRLYGPVDLAPRDEPRLLADGNELLPASAAVAVERAIPWTRRVLAFRAPP